MKHRALLRRTLPLAMLATALYPADWPTFAFFFQKDEVAPTAATMAKNGPAVEPISFSEEDFVVEDSGKLGDIVITTLSDAAIGCLTLGTQDTQVGDVITMEAVDGLRFTLLAIPAGLEVQFRFAPIFSDGRSGDAVTAELYLLAETNGAPVAGDLEFTTYKNAAVTAQFSAVDPEGDLLTHHIFSKPARGVVAIPENGSSEFIYTPYENKTDKDSFTYMTVDTMGNSSDPAAVKIKTEKPNTKVACADIDGDPAHEAVVRLAEEGILVGECMDGAYFFQLDAAVTHGEFMTIAINVAGMGALEDVKHTGLASDVSIPTWAEPYVSSALKAELVQGNHSSGEQVVFQAEEPIIAAEAAVLLDRALQTIDVSTDTLAEGGIPTWAAQSAADLATHGVLLLDGGLSAPLTRGEAAELLYSALELQDSRDGGWL